MIDVRLGWTVLLATLPILLCGLGILGGIVANLMRLDKMSEKLDLIESHLASLGERVATLEERDRWTHTQLVKQ